MFKKLLVLFYALGLLITQKATAQPTPPVVKHYGKPLKGHFFITPLKMNKKGTPIKTVQIIANEKGEILYYNQLNYGSDFKINANGLMSYYEDEKIMLMNEQFEIIDAVFLPKEIELDAHDFLILPNGNYLTFGAINTIEDYSNKRVFSNATSTGSKNTKVRTGIVLELDKNNNIVFGWNSKNYFTIDEVDPVYLKDTAKIDIAHFNSIDVDADGNLLVSVRHCNQVVKINRTDSSVIWRMGGKRNEFTFENDSIPFFGQHDARYTAKNRFTLFDNGYTVYPNCHNARAIEYEINEQTKTCKKVWSYSPKQALISESTGNVQQLKNGNKLISYGRPQYFTSNISLEIIDSLQKPILGLWYADSLYSYRSYFYEELPFKLYTPKVICNKTRASNTLKTDKKYKFYQWNNGSQKAEITINTKGRFYVYVSNDGQKFFRSEVVNIE